MVLRSPDFSGSCSHYSNTTLPHLHPSCSSIKSKADPLQEPNSFMHHLPAQEKNILEGSCQCRAENIPKDDRVTRGFPREQTRGLLEVKKHTKATKKITFLVLPDLGKLDSRFPPVCFSDLNLFSWKKRKKNNNLWPVLPPPGSNLFCKAGSQHKANPGLLRKEFDLKDSCGC